MIFECRSAGGWGRAHCARRLLASLAMLALLVGACATVSGVDRAASNADLAATHNRRGDTLFIEGEFAAAIVEYREAIRLDPNLAMAHANLGSALAQQGELESALAEFREATRLEPTNAVLWLHLGKLHDRMGRGEDALHSLERGLEANPGDAGILNQIGWFYATVEPSTLRDPAKALDYAQRAVAASEGRDANVLDTLAEAHYANRDFDAAIEAEQKALELAPDVEAFRNRLQKFREAKAAESAR